MKSEDMFFTYCSVCKDPLIDEDTIYEGMCNECGQESEVDDTVSRAYNDLMTELFGEVPKNPGEREVSFEVYEKSMHRIQDKYELRHGHPKFLEWVLTITGRSPKITRLKEGAGENDGQKSETMGKTPPRETE